jgi:glycosyltransferase involved in cell wall biosynthesis
VKKTIFVSFLLEKKSYHIVSRIIKNIVENSKKNSFILFESEKDILTGKNILFKKSLCNRNSFLSSIVMFNTFFKFRNKIDTHFYVIDDPKTIFFYFLSFFSKKKISFLVRVGGSYEVRFNHLDKSSWLKQFYSVYLQKLIILLNLKISNKIIFVTKYCRDDFRKYFNLKKKKIYVIYNGIEIENSKKKVVFNSKKIVFNGRFVKQKRPELVLKLAQRLPEFHFIIITSGIKNAQLSHNLKNIVIYNQISISKVKEIYSKSDIFIMPSLMEGCSNALLEAMQCGLPVIVSNSGSLPELSKNRGFIVPVDENEVDVFKEKILELVSNVEIYKKFSINAKKFTKELSWKKVVKSYEEKF